jgi:type III restriction enzyme
MGFFVLIVLAPTLRESLGLFLLRKSCDEVGVTGRDALCLERLGNFGYPFAADRAHNGYFSQDKRGHFKDSTEKGSQDDNDTYALIMKDKERLLDPAEPLRFIFSHSALREGWDNPNVFQICTLAESNSEVKKRQEIGRGLRIAVDADLKRVIDPNINRLTIIANDSYEDFARDLQTEMEEQGIAFKKEMAPNARKMVKITLKKGYEADSNFLQLWERIRQQTRYRVRYSTEELITAAVLGVHAMPKIDRPKMIIARADLAITGAGITTIETGRKTQELDSKYVIPDLIAQIQARTSLSKSTVAAILLGSGRLDDAIKNPQAYIEHTAASINTTKRELLVKGVEYVKIDGMTYEMHRFEDDNLAEVFESNVIAVQKQEKTLFSHIIIDSGSQPEQNFAKACDANDDVHFYIKLPRWFEIETPVGAYHPDWALMYHNQKILYFIAETKGSGGAQGVDIGLLRPLEKLKIDCGYKHFEQFEEVHFKAVETLGELIA